MRVKGERVDCFENKRKESQGVLPGFTVLM